MSTAFRISTSISVTVGAGAVAVRRATSSATSGPAKAADTPGSRNYPGIKDPVVDALVDRVIFAKDRDELVAATHALDRVLLWNYYCRSAIAQAEGLAGLLEQVRHSRKSSRTTSAPDTESWWIDPEKEKALAAKYRSSN